MDTFRYLVRFLYRIRWYLVVLPLIALIVAWFLTRKMDRVYDVSTTIYTGMITGYNIEGGSGIAGGNSQTNSETKYAKSVKRQAQAIVQSPNSLTSRARLFGLFAIRPPLLVCLLVWLNIGASIK